ncbi:hypothetical protein BKA69DRAFT_1052078, partial [Paraphysoderma sedebokerense]
MTFHFDRLPYEIIHEIFILSGSPSLPLVSKSLHSLLSSSSPLISTRSKTEFLLSRYKCPVYAFIRGVKHGIFDLDVGIRLEQRFRELFLLDHRHHVGKYDRKPNESCDSNETINVTQKYHNPSAQNKISKLSNKYGVVFRESHSIPTFSFVGHRSMEGVELPKHLFKHTHLNQTMEKQRETLKYLLDKGYPVNSSNGLPLLLCVKQNRFDLLEILVEHKVDMSIRNNLAVAVAAKRNKIKMMKALLKYGAKAISTALQISYENGNLEMSQLLIKHGAVPEMSMI